MTKPEILSETPIHMADVKNKLAKIKKRDKELNFRANKTEEYLAQAVTLTNEKAKEIYSKIEKLDVPRLKDVHICKVIDIMPTTVESLRAVLQGYMLTVNTDNMKKIVAVVKEY